MEKDLLSLAEAMEPIVRSAGAYIRQAKPRSVDEKSGHTDLVTEFDVNTQRMLTEALGKLHPTAVFLGEEDHLSADVTKGDCFVIDPIDGTTNFVKGYNRSAVSVALLRNEVPVIGMVYNPWAEDFYCAIKGHGAFYNGEPVSIVRCPLKDSVVGCGTSPYYPDLAQRTVRILSKVLDVSLDIRRMGSAALDLCDLALSRTGAFFELKLSPWDYAAAGLILIEAGGVLSTLEGTPVSFRQASSVVAGNPQAQEELRQLINRID